MSTALTADVRQARLELAPLLVASMSPAVERCGYVIALYGSALKHGAGRDFDFMLVPFPTYAIPTLPAEAVRDALVGAGLLVLDFTRAPIDGRAAAGIVGKLHGYAVDITVWEGGL
jgi:hypothetical protein